MESIPFSKMELVPFSKTELIPFSKMELISFSKMGSIPFSKMELVSFSKMEFVSTRKLCFDASVSPQERLAHCALSLDKNEQTNPFLKKKCVCDVNFLHVLNHSIRCIAKEHRGRGCGHITAVTTSKLGGLDILQAQTKLICIFKPFFSWGGGCTHTHTHTHTHKHRPPPATEKKIGSPNPGRKPDQICKLFLSGLVDFLSTLMRNLPFFFGLTLCWRIHNEVTADQ